MTWDWMGFPVAETPKRIAGRSIQEGNRHSLVIQALASEAAAVWLKALARRQT